MHDTTLRRDFRPDIQGLRAVAVLLVVVYHLYPNRVSGGFVGVDVFFVLSGYLITAHLHREAETTGRLSLARFWGRRIRRLLPASLLVLAVATVATWAWVPRTMWEQTLQQVAASALYVQNWTLAAEAVDYSALGNEPTLVQHYWSLSVEEQFYLVWPLLVVAGLYAAKRLGLRPRGMLAATIAAVGLASFAYSVTVTSGDVARAYFVTPTRVWEFAAGALLALATVGGDVPRRRGAPAGRSARVTTATGWLGLLAVLWAAATLSGATPFPGWIAAVPTLGTVALVATGSAGGRLGVGRMLALRPLTFLGDISYAVYLWHWPMIVVLPYVTGVDLRTRDKVAIFLATVAVSWVSTRWVEDPLRTGRLLTAATWRPYALGATGMAVVLVATSGLRLDLAHDVEAADVAGATVVQRALAGDEPCIGPAVLNGDADAGCGPVGGTGAPVVDPAAVARQVQTFAFRSCMSQPDQGPVQTCDLGTTRHPRRTVAIVGDSHATHWFKALDLIGKARHWRIRTFTRSGCPLTDARELRENWPKQRYPLCWNGNDEVERRLLARPRIDTVLVSADSSSYDWAQPPGAQLADPAIDGFRAVWRRLVAAGKQVIVIRDVPETHDDSSVPDCLAAHPDDAEACAVPRSEGLARDVEADAARGVHGVRLIDLSDQFCDQRLCYGRIGDVIVYRDLGHLSDEYSALLAPYLARAIDAVDRPLH